MYILCFVSIGLIAALGCTAMDAHRSGGMYGLYDDGTTTSSNNNRPTNGEGRQWINLRCTSTNAPLELNDCSAALQASIPSTKRFTTTQGGLHATSGGCHVTVDGDAVHDHAIQKTILSANGQSALQADCREDGRLLPGTAMVLSERGDQFNLTWGPSVTSKRFVHI